MNVRRIVTLVILLFLVVAERVFAGPIPIDNPSFEADVLCDGCVQNNITDWLTSAGGGDGVFNPTTTHYPGGNVPDGENVAYVNLTGNSVRQILSSLLEYGSTYVLQVEVGNRLDIAFAGYRVQLRAGGVILAEDFSSQSPAPGEFVTARVTYTPTIADAQLGQPIEIWLLSPGVQANYDDVRFTRELSLFSDGFESGDTSFWTDSSP